MIGSFIKEKTRVLILKLSQVLAHFVDDEFFAFDGERRFLSHIESITFIEWLSSDGSGKVKIVYALFFCIFFHPGKERAANALSLVVFMDVKPVEFIFIEVAIANDFVVFDCDVFLECFVAFAVCFGGNPGRPDAYLFKRIVFCVDCSNGCSVHSCNDWCVTGTRAPDSHMKK